MSKPKTVWRPLPRTFTEEKPRIGRRPEIGPLIVRVLREASAPLTTLEVVLEVQKLRQGTHRSTIGPQVPKHAKLHSQRVLRSEVGNKQTKTNVWVSKDDA
jgi:hypothetical protein